jgi:GT2 family glycosyltransferase
VTVDLGATADVAAALDSQVPRIGDCGDIVVREVSPSSARPGAPAVTGPPPVTGPVLAVLVARNGEAFLPRALAALSAQTRRPDAVIGVDTGSEDASAHLLAKALPAVLSLPARSTFADAVTAAVAVDAATRLGDGDPRPDTPVAPPETADRWIWLLHDDCAPAPDALERLLAAVETAPSVAVAGCKHIGWDDDQRILGVGLATTRSGTRVPVADRNEVDQGQHDGRSDVLAVGTAGMLLRADLWQELGGPDPALAHARDDLDLCRRAHLAGHRVIVVPGAAVSHAAAWETGRRPGASSWHRADRRDALHQRLAAIPAPLLALPLLASALTVVPRAVAQLALRRWGRALDEVLAPLAVWSRPDRWLRSRRRSSRIRRVPRRVVGTLYASPLHLLRRLRDEAAAWIVPGPGTQPGPGTRRQGDEPSGDGDGERRARSRRRAFAATAGVPVILLTAVASVTALHRLLGPGAAAGPDLLPAPSTAEALWKAARSSWRPTGLGAPAVADPLDALLALLSLCLGGVPGRAVDLLLLGGLPLAAASAWLAAGTLTRSRLIRAWAGLVWAASPPLLGALSAGRIGAILAHVLLPVAATAVARAACGGCGGQRCHGRGPARRHAAAGGVAGLLLAAVLSGAPSLAVATVVAVALIGAGAMAAGHGVSAVAAGLLPALAVPAAVLLPWWIAVAGEPRLLLAGTQPAASTAAGPGEGVPVGAVEDLLRLLGHGFPLSATGLAALVVAVLGGPVVLAGLGGVLRPGAVALPAAATGLAGLATALVAGRVDIGATGSGLDAGAPLTGPCGPGLSLALAGIGTAAVVFARAGRRGLRPRGHRLLRRLAPLTTAGLAMTLLGGPLAVLGGWVWQGVAGPSYAAHGRAPAVHRVDPDVLPAVAAQEAEGDAAARTLVVRADRSEVRWTLARAAGPRLGDDSAALAALRLRGARAVSPEPAPPGEGDLVAPVLAALLGDGGTDVRGRLAELGVGSVLLVPPVKDGMALALDASPGPVRVATVDGAGYWRVDLAARPGAPTRAVRARLVDGTGFTVAALASDGDVVDATVPPRAGPRYVVLTERFDTGWTATLDGRPLRSLATSGWAQCFELPATGGRLRIDHGSGLSAAVGPIQAGALLLAVAGPLPLPSLRRRLARPVPPAPSRPVRRSAPGDPQGGSLRPAPRVFDADHPATGAVAPLFADTPDGEDLP